MPLKAETLDSFLKTILSYANVHQYRKYKEYVRNMVGSYTDKFQFRKNLRNIRIGNKKMKLFDKIADQYKDVNKFGMSVQTLWNGIKTTIINRRKSNEKNILQKREEKREKENLSAERIRINASKEVISKNNMVVQDLNKLRKIIGKYEPESDEIQNKINLVNKNTKIEEKNITKPEYKEEKNQKMEEKERRKRNMDNFMIFLKDEVKELKEDHEHKYMDILENLQVGLVTKNVKTYIVKFMMKYPYMVVVGV